MKGFVDYLRMAMGWWSGFESTTPDPVEGQALRLRCNLNLTLQLTCINSATFRLRQQDALTLRLPMR